MTHLPPDPQAHPSGASSKRGGVAAGTPDPRGMGSWFCIVCDATGQSERFDKDAEKHTKATGHGTVTSLRDPVPLAQCIAEVRKQLEKRRG